MIVIPENAADIVQAVQHARQYNLKIAVQSTGHGVIRPADARLILLTSSACKP